MTQPGQIRSFKSYEGSKRVLSQLPSVKTYDTGDRECATRQSGYKRGYGKDWDNYRDWYLKHHKFCALCGRMAVLVDHIRPLRYGGARLDLNNLQPLCRKCHASKTATDNAVADSKKWAPLWGKGVESSGQTPGRPARAPSLKN